MKYKPVLRQTNVLIEISGVIFLLLLAMIPLARGASLFFGIIIIMIPIIIGLKRLPEWLKFRKFKHLPKASVPAHIIARQVVSKSGKHGTSHTYYVTYSFETVEGKGPFIFVETVIKPIYKQLQVGTQLTVNYAIADPRMAWSSLYLLIVTITD